jgi:hypothetical protein
MTACRGGSLQAFFMPKNKFKILLFLFGYQIIYSQVTFEHKKIARQKMMKAMANVSK